MSAAEVVVAEEQGQRGPVVKGIIADDEVPRQCLKADYKIVATAIRHGALAIYVDDKHFDKIANNRIAVRPVPKLWDMAQPPEETRDPITTGHKGDLFDGAESPPEPEKPSPLAFELWRARLPTTRAALAEGTWLTPATRKWGREAAYGP